MARSSHVIENKKETDASWRLPPQAIKNIEALRANLGENHTDFAKRMGMKYNAYDNAMKRRRFALRRLYMLARSADVTLDFLVGLTAHARPIELPGDRPPTLWEKLSRTN
jgi:hypothetical protein